MLGGVNDSDDDADRLAALLRRHKLQRVKVNLIPHNGAEQLDYHASTPERVKAFKMRLEARGVSAYVRIAAVATYSPPADNWRQRCSQQTESVKLSPAKASGS